MADGSRTMTDDGFHEIQLSGKQLVFLFMATTVVSVAIFLCGVFVGRGVSTGAAAQAPFAGMAETGVVVPGSDEPAEPSGGLPSALDEELSYPERLDGRTAEHDALRVEEPPPAISEEPPPAPPQGAAAATPPARETTPALRQADQPAREAVGPALDAGEGFTVQIAALRERNEAMALMRRLASKGYPAYVLDPVAGAPTPVYRVRVGRYPDRPAAEQVVRRLEQEERFEPWITR